MVEAVVRSSVSVKEECASGEDEEPAVVATVGRGGGAAVAVATDGMDRLSKFTAGRWELSEAEGVKAHQSISRLTIC